MMDEQAKALSRNMNSTEPEMNRNKRKRKVKESMSNNGIQEELVNRMQAIVRKMNFIDQKVGLFQIVWDFQFRDHP